ncbi:hypothetical protein SESBI_44449 [Sesbania bispinosa]|nr:hypothetical protein SESBI_44449 [Sesbania bispinosa]
MTFCVLQGDDGDEHVPARYSTPTFLLRQGYDGDEHVPMVMQPCKSRFTSLRF